MGFYSEEIIDEVLSANDIYDVISERVSLKKVGSTYLGLCPFHNENTGSFSVTPRKQMFYCFGCHVGGNVITFIQKYEGKTFPEAVETLAERAGIKLPENSYTNEERAGVSKRSKLLEIYKKAAFFYYNNLYEEEGKQGLMYLKNRGLSDSVIKRFGLGYAKKGGNTLYKYLKEEGYDDEILKISGLISFSEKGSYDKFWNRVIFPIMDRNNRVVAFGGRVMGDGKPKYLNSPETMIFVKSEILYGFNVARTTREDYLLLCEGYMDVIALHNAGFKNAVAALGTAFGEKNATNISKLVKKVVLTFDNDLAGIDATLRAIPILKEKGIRIKVVDMSPYKDPDEFIKNMGRDAYADRIRNATDEFIFRVMQKMKNYDLKVPGDKAEFYDEIAKMLMEYRDDLDRNVYIDEISDRFKINKDDLKQKVKMIARDYKKDVDAKTLSELRKKENLNNPLSMRNKKNEKEEKVHESERMLFTWLIEDVNNYKKISKYIDESDFEGGPYEEVAKVLFSQLKEGVLDVSKILLNFSEEEDAKEIAEIFNTPFRSLLLEDTYTTQDIEKSVNQIVRKIKTDRLENLYKQINADKTGEIAKKYFEENMKIRKMKITL